MENNKDVENIIKKALEEIRQEEGSEVKGRCLTDTEKCSLIDGRVPKELRDVFLDHILSCKKCAQDLKADLTILENMEKDASETPKEWEQDILKAVRKTPSSQPESKHPRKVEFETVMHLADEKVCASKPCPTLMIKNFKVVLPPFARRGRTPAPPRIVKKIYFTCNYDCYVYLFEIKEKKVSIIVQKEKFLKNVKNELASRIKKQLALSKKRKLILIFSRELFKNIANIRKALLLFPDATPVKLANLLRQEGEKVVVRFI